MITAELDKALGSVRTGPERDGDLRHEATWLAMITSRWSLQVLTRTVSPFGSS